MNTSFTQSNNSDVSSSWKNSKNKFTKEEDKLWLELAEKYQEKQWQKISEFFVNKNYIQCFSRYKRIHPNLRHEPWSEKEDNLILKYHLKYGNKWAKISKELKNRSGKQVRDRFINVINPLRNTNQFTPEEDIAIIEGFHINGPQWAKIAKEVGTGRNPDMVKNRFYCHLKHKKQTTLSLENVQVSSMEEKTWSNISSHEMTYREIKPVEDKIYEVEEWNDTTNNCFNIDLTSDEFQESKENNSMFPIDYESNTNENTCSYDCLCGLYVI